MRNILLIVVDTLRPDHLGCYGYSRDTSPALDALAARSSVLDACWSASNFTAPAFTSLFTGCYPSQHGVWDFTSQVATSVFKQCLDANGVHTGGVVTFRFFSNLLRRIWGDIEVVTDGRSFDYSKDLPRAVTEGALAWLDQHDRQSSFCLFVHYDGPHGPYRLPAAYETLFDTVPGEDVQPRFRDAMFPQDREELSSDQHAVARDHFKLIQSVNLWRRSVTAATRAWLIDKYDASIRYNDDMIALLLDGLGERGLDRDTIVCVLSDHGEEFLDHGQFAHGGIHLYEEIIRTVGIVYDPDRAQAVRLPQPISQVGILPALIDMAGGQSLPDLPAAGPVPDLLQPEDPDQSPPIYCMGRARIAVRDGQMKWIHTHPSHHLRRWPRLKTWSRLLLSGELKDELYDLAADPQEKTNLAGDRQRVRRMAALWQEHLNTTRGQSLLAGTAEELEADEKARIEKEMRDLGYM